IRELSRNVGDSYDLRNNFRRNKSLAGMKTCQQKHNTLAAGMTIPNINHHPHHESSPRRHPPRHHHHHSPRHHLLTIATIITSSPTHPPNTTSPSPCTTITSLLRPPQRQP
nr:hypothetical protein [Tanacetum cinerariifolium]